MELRTGVVSISELTEVSTRQDILIVPPGL